MSELIVEFHISQPPTASRRKVLEKMIDQNAPKSPWPVSYEWEDVHTLRVRTDPVEWEVLFEDHKVQIHASAPFWARMLLTKKKKQLLIEIFEDALADAGFFDEGKETKPAKKKAAKPRK